MAASGPTDERILIARLELVPVIADDADELIEVFGDHASATVATRAGLHTTGDYRWHEGVREQLWRRRVEGPPVT